MAGLVELEIPATAPERGVHLAGGGHFRKTREIGRRGDRALDQQPIAFARGLYSEWPLELEMAAGTHHQIGGEPEASTVERIVVTPPPGKAGHEFTLEEVGGAGRTGEVGPGDTRHCDLGLAG